MFIFRSSDYRIIIDQSNSCSDQILSQILRMRSMADAPYNTAQAQTLRHVIAAAL